MATNPTGRGYDMARPCAQRGDCVATDPAIVWYYIQLMLGKVLRNDDCNCLLASSIYLNCTIFVGILFHDGFKSTENKVNIFNIQYAFSCFL